MRLKPILIPLLTILLFLSIAISVNLGAVQIPLTETIKVIFSVFQATKEVSPIHEIIVLNLRLPRILLALITGAALAVVGASLQALFRNPLADPYIVGVSSGAALFASIAIFFGLVAFIPLAGFLGALSTMYIVYNLAKIGSRVPIDTLLLAGVVMSASLSALIALIMALMGENMHTIMFWLMGNMTESNPYLITLVLIIVLAGVLILYALSRDMNSLLFGEETAQHLGVDAERLKRRIFIIASLITGAVVSVTGLIGFVGLIIPHTVRIVTGPDHRLLIPCSALAGGTFLILTDALARTIIAPAEIPIGVVTAIMGGPFFLFLLVRKKGRKFF